MAKWYFESNGLQYGPVSVGELRLLAAAGRLKPTDRVRKHTMAVWARARAVRGLFVPEPAHVHAGGPDAAAPNAGEGSSFEITSPDGSPPADAQPGTEEMPVLPVVPVAAGRLVIATVAGRAVDLRLDGTAAVLDGLTTLQLIPGWIAAATAV